MNALQAPHYALMTATLVFGLALDIHTGFLGQMLISAAVWAVLFYLLAYLVLYERKASFACLAIATVGEMVLSLGWGLYTVPPGQYPALRAAGTCPDAAARCRSARAACPIRWRSRYSAAPPSIPLRVALRDSIRWRAVLVVLLLVLAVSFPHHRRLYASTFLLSLALELYGTWLGNWTWAHAVPKLRLVTTNPPALAGVFYATLDACVLAAMLLLRAPSESGAPCTRIAASRSIHMRRSARHVAKLRHNHVFVTGATGYMERALIPVLLARAHSVRALARPGSEQKLRRRLTVAGDALDATSFQDRIAPADADFRFLARTPHPAP